MRTNRAYGDAYVMYSFIENLQICDPSIGAIRSRQSGRLFVASLTQTLLHVIFGSEATAGGHLADDANGPRISTPDSRVCVWGHSDGRGTDDCAAYAGAYSPLVGIGEHPSWHQMPACPRVPHQS